MGDIFACERGGCVCRMGDEFAVTAGNGMKKVIMGQP